MRSLHLGAYGLHKQTCLIYVAGRRRPSSHFSWLRTHVSSSSYANYTLRHSASCEAVSDCFFWYSLVYLLLAVKLLFHIILCACWLSGEVRKVRLVWNTQRRDFQISCNLGAVVSLHDALLTAQMHSYRRVRCQVSTVRDSSATRMGCLNCVQLTCLTTLAACAVIFSCIT